MSRRRHLLLWFLAVAVLGGAWLLTTRAQPTRLPADPDHALEQAEARCLTCHAHAGRRPRPTDHPLRDDCFSCHRDPSGALHPRPDAPIRLPGGWADDPRLPPRRTPTGA